MEGALPAPPSARSSSNGNIKVQPTPAAQTPQSQPTPPPTSTRSEQTKDAQPQPAPHRPFNRPTIKSMMKKIEEKTEEKETTLEKIASNNEFSQEMMISAWNQYIKGLAPERQILINTMESCKPTLEENYQLIQKVDNSVQEKEMNEEKIDLLNFLRVNLANGNINLTIFIAEASEREKILSPMDRFNKLMEENKEFENFVNEYQLELEI
jgi:DNA polymerase-3 subunit gamma/tau